MDITEGNWYFKKKVIKNADVTNMVLERGATFYDSDFWKWMICGLTGDMSMDKFGIGALSLQQGGLTPRRTLLLVQFFSRSPLPLTGAAATAASALTPIAIEALGASLTGNVSPAGLLSGAVAGALGALGGQFEVAARIPAKAWLIYGAIPVRYKAAGDFDAMSSAISIQPLELAIEMIEEVSLAA